MFQYIRRDNGIDRFLKKRIIVEVGGLELNIFKVKNSRYLRRSLGIQINAGHVFEQLSQGRQKYAVSAAEIQYVVFWMVGMFHEPIKRFQSFPKYLPDNRILREIQCGFRMVLVNPFKNVSVNLYKHSPPPTSLPPNHTFFR
jgi:hypothetical protein